jgi:N-acetyl sugar amidotransferase
MNTPSSQAGRRVQYCQVCVMPNTRPRIVFDDEGVCNACRNADDKRSIDWDARELEFQELVEPYRSKDGSWDCIVPWSGGKDSSTIAYRLKFELGMNPLLVTFSPLIPNDVGNHNRDAIVRLGFDHIFFRPNEVVNRRLAQRFFMERGNLKVAWDAGVNTIPVKVAVKFGIPLIFYAEHGESEYGGRVLSEESKRTRDFTEVLEHQIGDDPQNWVDDEITPNDLNPYTYPDPDEIEAVGVKALYYAYFFKWSMFENYEFIRTKIDFHTTPFGRTDGTFTHFDSLDDKTDNLYYYMQYIKFGFGRAIRDACRMIQNGQLSREEGVRLALEFDAEFPNQYLAEVTEYLGVSTEELVKMVDQHRNDEIWAKEAGEWSLRFPPL